MNLLCILGTGYFVVGGFTVIFSILKSNSLWNDLTF